MDEIEIGTKLSDHEAMRFAIAQAAKGLGSVSPNPAVGCVILDNNSCLLSAGYHEKYGGPHAEVNALRGLTHSQLTGARVFVTLEPCAHHGKTPPCAEALAKLPLKEVIFGLFDPNPLVQGKGAEIIRHAGITATHFDDLKEKLEQSCEHFLKNMRANLPFVTLKLASSLDGKIALKNGQSQWITGPEAREETHRLRAHHDAILVGVDTFLTDNPSLTIRHPSFPDNQNKVIVVDPNGRGLVKFKTSKIGTLYPNSSVFWIVNKKPESNSASSINIIEAPLAADQVHIDLAEVKKALWSHSIKSIFVEGGARTISSFLNQKAADRLSLFLSPMIIGEQSGLSWTQNLNPIENLKEAIGTSSLEMSSFGKDLLLTCRFL